MNTISDRFYKGANPVRPANEHPGTKEHHTYDRETGYQSAEYEHQEYPKTMPNGDIVADAEAEAIWRANQQPPAAAPADSKAADESPKPMPSIRSSRRAAEPSDE
jgi:hypothetical protein